MKPAAQRSRHLAPGDKLGKFDLIRQIAIGGMAEIYLARTVGIEGFEKLVVVKRILPMHASNAAFVDMFLNEARLAATLQHPNVAQVYDIGVDAGEYFFAMEYVHGEDLDRITQQSNEQGVPLSMDVSLTLVAGLCAGLHYAHEKEIVHRDVSPSNVIISYDGAVKLVDFGIARATSQQSTTHGGLKGKIAYMSPEQCRSSGRIDRRCDVFAVGMILYELTCGQLPFTGETEYQLLDQVVNRDVPPPSSLVPGYPPALERILLRALARDRDRRYSTALELQGALEDFAHESRLRVSPLVLARLMSSLFPARLEEWADAKAQGAFFVEQHVVRTLIEDGRTPPPDDPALRAAHEAIRAHEAIVAEEEQTSLDPVVGDDTAVGEPPITTQLPTVAQAIQRASMSNQSRSPTPNPTRGSTPNVAPVQTRTPTPNPTRGSTPNVAPVQTRTPTPDPTRGSTPNVAPVTRTPTPNPTRGSTPNVAPVQTRTPTPDPTSNVAAHRTPTPDPTSNVAPHRTLTPDPTSSVAPHRTLTPDPTSNIAPHRTPTPNPTRSSTSDPALHQTRTPTPDPTSQAAPDRTRTPTSDPPRAFNAQPAASYPGLPTRMPGAVPIIGAAGTLVSSSLPTQPPGPIPTTPPPVHAAPTMRMQAGQARPIMPTPPTPMPLPPAPTPPMPVPVAVTQVGDVTERVNIARGDLTAHIRVSGRRSPLLPIVGLVAVAGGIAAVIALKGSGAPAPATAASAQAPKAEGVTAPAEPPTPAAPPTAEAQKPEAPPSESPPPAEAQKPEATPSESPPPATPAPVPPPAPPTAVPPPAPPVESPPPAPAAAAKTEPEAKPIEPKKVTKVASHPRPVKRTVEKKKPEPKESPSWNADSPFMPVRTDKH